MESLLFFTKSKNLTQKNSIYLGEIFEQKNYRLEKIFHDANFLSNEYINDNSSLEKYREFFIQIGILENYLLIKSFPLILNQENSVKIINYIFNEYYSNYEKRKEIPLNYENIFLITNKGSYKNAKELILPDIFCDDVDLEEFIKEDIYISTDYYIKKENNVNIIKFMKILGIKSKENIIGNLDHLEEKNSIEYLKILFKKQKLWYIVRKKLNNLEIILTQSGKFVTPSQAILSDHFYEKFLIQKSLPKEINFISENYFNNNEKNEMEIWEIFLQTIGLNQRDCLNETVHEYLDQRNSVELLNYILSYVIVNKSISKTNEYIENLKKGFKVKTTKNSYNEISSLYFSKIDDVDISKIVDNDIFISSDYINNLDSRNFFSKLGILDINHFFNFFDKYITKENNYQLIKLAFKKAKIGDYVFKPLNLNVFSSNENYCRYKKIIFI